MPYANDACLNPLVARSASAIGPEMTLPTPIINRSNEIIVGGEEISSFAMTVIILGHRDGKLKKTSLVFVVQEGRRLAVP